MPYVYIQMHTHRKLSNNAHHIILPPLQPFHDLLPIFMAEANGDKLGSLAAFTLPIPCNLASLGCTMLRGPRVVPPPPCNSYAKVRN